MGEKFYTNCALLGNYVLYRGIENGERVSEKIAMKPKLFLPSNEPTKFKTLDGKYAAKIEFADINEAKEFVKKYRDVPNFVYYGNTRYQYVYLGSTFPDEIEYDYSKIIIANIDIEVASENRFAPVEDPSEEIISITLKTNGKFYVFGCGNFTPQRDNVYYIKSKNEVELLTKFLDFWGNIAPDIVTGWNCVPLNSKIWTNSGIVTIDKFSVGDDLYGRNQKIKKIFPISKKKTWVITLANGHRILSSGEHKFYVINKKSKYENINQMKKHGFWCKTKDITPNSYLTIFKNQKNNYTNNLEMLDLYYVLGIIFSDGTKKGKNIVIYNTKMEILERISRFNNIHKISRNFIGTGISLSKRHTKRVRIYLIDNHILSKYINLIYDGDQKRLDVENFSKISKKEFLAFLSGLIDGAGHIDMHGGVFYCNYDGQIENLYSLLLWNNIICSKVSKNKLRIFKRCVLDLNLSHPIKKKRLDNNKFFKMSYSIDICPNPKSKIIETEDAWYVRVDSVVETDQLTDMIDIETTNHEFILDGVRTHNCQFYDIPYLVNRIARIFGDKEAKRMSPWGYLSTRNAMYKGRQHQVVDLVGIATLDYIEMYRKFRGKQESEKLNYIAYVELGEKKISYEEYGSLHNLYKENYQLFIEYNIKDVDLVDKLENKLKLIEMCVAIAYDAKVNYVDVFAQVRMWDAIVFNYLRKRNIVVPRIDEKEKDAQYAGAYVKEVKPGMYEWVVSFDLNSLYPNLIAQFNISPECLVPEEFRNVNIKDLIDKKINLNDLKEKNIGMAANGHCFRNDKLGFFPDILMRMYEDRKVYKKKMLEAQKELELVKEELHRRGIA